MKRKIVDNHRGFEIPGLKFSVSGRRILPGMAIAEYLENFYYFIPPSRIESVFGAFAFPSRLYGGWGYDENTALDQQRVGEMKNAGIAMALTLSNYYFDETFYRETVPMLERLHWPGNIIIAASDRLARRIRLDFPLYRLRASLVRKLDTLEKIEKAMDLYDDVVVPMDKNDDFRFLSSLPEKSRIVLFANAGCAYTCPKRTCYIGNSQDIQGRRVTARCSKKRVPREKLGYVVFDLEALSALGFTNFKVIPPRTLRIANFLAKKSAEAVNA